MDANYFFFGLCDNALAAADFAGAELLLLRKTFEAALAALADVTFMGIPVCPRALPAAFFAAALADPDRSVFEAADAAFL